MASVQPRASRSRPTSASIGRSSPLNTMSPSAARTSASSASSSALACSSLSPRAVRRTLMPSMPLARNAIVAVARLVEHPQPRVEQLGHARLALAPRAQHPADDHLPHAGPGRQVGQHGPLQHLLHLVRHAGHRVDHLVAHRADQPGRRAGALLDHRGADRHVGLAQVVVGHRAAARREQLADHVGDRVVAHELDAHHLGDGLAGDVVLRGAEPAAHDHRVGSLERLA